MPREELIISRLHTYEDWKRAIDERPADPLWAIHEIAGRRQRTAIFTIDYPNKWASTTRREKITEWRITNDVYTLK